MAARTAPPYSAIAAWRSLSDFPIGRDEFVMSQFSLEPRVFPLCLASPQCPAEQQTRCRNLFDHLSAQSTDNALAMSHLLAVLDSRGVMERAQDKLAVRSN